jgi:peptidoglycan/LPS O-acetylase OafA/YrhL
MVLKQLYYDKTNKQLITYFLILFFFQSVLIFNAYTFVFSVITCILLFLFVYKPSMISFLGGTSISKVGIASYSIYLIHENIGVLLINKLSYLFNDFNWLLGLVIFLLISSFGVYSYKYLEVPFGKKIKSIVFRNTQ